MSHGPFREHARAKINLTLTIHGRRADGYHELSSVVAFASVADEIVLTPSSSPSVASTGPFADAIEGRNLAEAAMSLALAEEPRLRAGRIEIVKNLPVAAGLGGGSADAAAVLRALRSANPDLAHAVDWKGLAARLGADVTVCLENRPALMTGIGETVAPLPALPRVPVVLVNPCVPVPSDKTRRVFRELAAPTLDGAPASSAVPNFATPADVIACVTAGRNDLEAPSRAVVAAVGDVLRRLESEPNVAVVRLSGAGPTAFAMFAEDGDAEAAAARIARAHPSWWVAATEIGGA